MAAFPQQYFSFSLYLKTAISEQKCIIKWNPGNMYLW